MDCSAGVIHTVWHYFPQVLMLYPVRLWINGYLLQYYMYPIFRHVCISKEQRATPQSRCTCRDRVLRPVAVSGFRTSFSVHRLRVELAFPSHPPILTRVLQEKVLSLGARPRSLDAFLAPNVFSFFFLLVSYGVRALRFANHTRCQRGRPTDTPPSFPC